jgi:hypothetical protein
MVMLGRGDEKDATLLQQANKTAIAPRFRRREKAECRVVVDMVLELELELKIELSRIRCCVMKAN